MKFNIRKAKKESKEQYDSLLEENREKTGHGKPVEGTYEKNLDSNRKNTEPDSIFEKTLSKHHTEGKTSPRTTEALFSEGKKWDDSTHKTNTLPINELAEEAQRKRIKERGDGDGFEDGHFQNYKKESIDLSKENYAKLSNANLQMDKLWMASAWSRMTTAEKKKIIALKETRDSILRKLS